MIKYFDNRKFDIDPKKAAEVRKQCKEVSEENLRNNLEHNMKLKMASVYGEMIMGGKLHD